jgi:hypothetical protein
MSVEPMTHRGRSDTYKVDANSRDVALRERVILRLSSTTDS